MRIFFDTEFIDDGSTIEPLSIGMVTEHDDVGLYAVVTDTNRHRASDWVRCHVLPGIDVAPMNCYSVRGSRQEIARTVLEWVNARTDNPEFWADYAAYDWVLLCQLFGTMMHLPERWPMFCRDIQQEAHRLDVHDLPDDPENAHNALADARTTRTRWRVLQRAAEGV